MLIFVEIIVVQFNFELQFYLGFVFDFEVGYEIEDVKCYVCNFFCVMIIIFDW